MPPQKVTMKNKNWNLAKVENGFLILTFLGTFCHIDKFAFWNQHKFSLFFDTLYDLGKTSSWGHFLNFLTKKSKKI
jgi:hypothetical protein